MIKLYFKSARIEATASSLLNEGEKIFNSVRNDEEKAFNGMKKEAGNICSGIQDIIKNGRIKEIASDAGVMASLMYLEATSTDKNFLKKAPDLVKVYENKLLVDANNIWSTYSKEDEVGSGLIKNLYKDAVNIENKVGSVADTGWEEYKKINPIGAGIIAGTYDFGKGTIEGLVGVGKGIGNEYYDLRENPEGTIKNLARVGIDIAALVNPAMPKTEDDERFEKGLEGIISKEINDKLINGDTYTRSRAITDIGENIVSLFLGGAEIKAASKVGEIGDLGKLDDVSETGENISKVENVSGSSLEVGSNVENLWKEVDISKLDDNGVKDLMNNVNKSGLSAEEKVLANIQIYNKALEQGIKIDMQVIASPKFIDSAGRIKWPEQNGYTIDATTGKAIKNEVFPQKGNIIDRYGTPDGTFTSPVINNDSISYEQRALPYLDNMNAYHKYEVTRDFSQLSDAIKNCKDKDLIELINADALRYGIDLNNLKTYGGEIAKAFNAIGEGTQWQLPLSIQYLKKLGFLKEIK